MYTIVITPLNSKSKPAGQRKAHELFDYFVNELDNAGIHANVEVRRDSPDTILQYIEGESKTGE
jgi:hypothetical protein